MWIIKVLLSKQLYDSQFHRIVELDIMEREEKKPCFLSFLTQISLRAPEEGTKIACCPSPESSSYWPRYKFPTPHIIQRGCACVKTVKQQGMIFPQLWTSELHCDKLLPQEKGILYFLNHKKIKSPIPRDLCELTVCTKNQSLALIRLICI